MKNQEEELKEEETLVKEHNEKVGERTAKKVAKVQERKETIRVLQKVDMDGSPNLGVFGHCCAVPGTSFPHGIRIGSYSGSRNRSNTRPRI